jgi:CDP-diacylglycerol--glycerol-3-phosphate 3-phosphatidyltransferase/cardiolipin synthase
VLIKIKQNIPNTLTFFRLFSSPIFILFFFFENNFFKLFAGILFVFCGITDFLDGALARKWKVESKIGQIFDPIADKLIVISAIVMLIYDRSIDGFNVFAGLLILLREVVISGLREALSALKFNLRSSFLGKCKTAIQITSISILIFSTLNFTNIKTLNFIEHVKHFGIYILWLSALLSLYSGFEYLRQSLSFLQNQKNKE